MVAIWTVISGSNQNLPEFVNRDSQALNAVLSAVASTGLSPSLW